MNPSGPISPLSDGSDQVAGFGLPRGDTGRLGQLLAEDSGATVAEVAAFWRAGPSGRQLLGIEESRRLARWFLEAGQPLLAFDVAEEGLRLDPAEVELRQIQGLALARTGAAERAGEILSGLRDADHADEETLGILARTHKDRALRSNDPERRRSHFREALGIYEEAWRTTGGYWTGINVATLCLFLGDRERSRVVAAEVRARCEAERNRMSTEGGDPYWILATLGEAALLGGDWEKAARWYRQAAAVCGGEWGNLSSTRRQARLIMDHLEGEGDRGPIEECLRIPSVVVFVGHMVDQPGRPEARFPAALIPALKEALHERLAELNAGFGFSSGACGSDLLFQECVAERGGKTHLLLPFPEPEFIAESVDGFPGADWGTRFEQARSRATEVMAASPHRLTWGGVIYDYANQLLLGRAQMFAAQLQTELFPVAVWDGRPGDGHGGTATVVERWRTLGHAVELIRIDELRRREGLDSVKANIGGRPGRLLPPLPAPPPAPLTPVIRAILFADMVDFSELNEEQIVAFLRHGLRVIGEFAAETDYPPRIRNTWGDGLFCAFDTVRQAALFALGLRDHLDRHLTERGRGERDGVDGVDPAGWGLPGKLAWRIGLHAGPVFSCTDPVTTEPTYLGSHVNLAARIEPVTPPGEIYASWAFAALASAEQAAGFSCDYAGVVPCAKAKGPLQMYRVRRD